MKEPLISLCMIVKDEEENLPGCLESVRGLVDEIVLVDTGSQDGTVAIAEAFGAKVFHMPWPDDFSEARNKSIEYARGDWIIYLDADERIDSNGVIDCIRKTASVPAVDAWSVNIRNRKCDTVAVDITCNIRLFRNMPPVRFENEVHERVEPALARIGARISTAPFFIDHLGYMVKPDAMKEKLRRNLLLSQRHLEREPDDSYCLYYAGATHLLLQEIDESREYFQRALDSKNLPRFLNAMTCNLMAYLELKEDRSDEAIAFAQKSSELVSQQNTCYLLKGLAHFRKSHFSTALPLLAGSHEFLQLPPEQRRTDLSQEHAFIDEAEFHKLIGICCSETNKSDDALLHFRQYLRLRGEDSEVARRAGICSVNAGDFNSGLQYLELAERLGAEHSEIALPMAFACIKLKYFDRAKSILDEMEKKLGSTEKIIEITKHLKAEMRSAGHAFATALPRISLCMIAKNEAERLPACLESVRGLVDEIILVDTGSQDKTREVALSHDARVISFPWKDDFAAARNESLRHATGNWIIFLDADEKLNPLGKDDCLRKAASTPGLDAFTVPIINWRPDGKTDSTLGRAVRFFRNFPGICFAGRVHETVEYFLIQAGAISGHAPFEIEHFGYGLDPATIKTKYQRNLKLLQQELAEDPKNANARYHLGLTFMALECEAEARRAFDQALLGNCVTPALKAMILNMKSYHHLRAGELLPAAEAASLSVEITPAQNTGRLLKGLTLFYMNRFADAIPLLLESYRFLSLPPEQRTSDISFEDSIDKIELVEKIGICFSECGKFAEALPFLKLAAHSKPGPAVFERLGINFLSSEQYPAALEYLQKAQAGMGEPTALALPLSFASLRTGDFERAAAYYCRAVPKNTQEVTVAFQILQAMAAEAGFRKYLPDCLRSKLNTFRSAFPENLERLIAVEHLSGFTRPQTEA
ncbi:MAG: glycosyltransferase [Syntrophobacteraceae bacterium]